MSVHDASYVERASARDLFSRGLQAVQLQTRMPLCTTDEPSAPLFPWLSAVGLLVGLLWALLGEIGLALGATGWGAGVVVGMAMVASSGGAGEVRIASWLEEQFTRWRGYRDREDGFALPAFVACGALLWRVGAIAGASSLATSVVASALMSRWVLSLAPLALPRGDGPGPAYLPHALTSAAVLFAAIMMKGADGAFLCFLCLAAAVLWSRRGDCRSLESIRETGWPLVLLIELVVLAS